MKLSEISIPKRFLCTTPSQRKLNECRKSFFGHSELDRELVVDESNTLTDGYVGYLVLMENGVDEYPVTQVSSPYIIVAAVHPGRQKAYYWRTTKTTRNVDLLAPGATAWVNTSQGRQVVEVVQTYTKANAPVAVPHTERLKTVVCALTCP